MEYPTVILGHMAAQVSTLLLVALVLNRTVLVELCNQFTAIVGNQHIERCELLYQTFADTAQELVYASSFNRRYAYLR